MENLEGRVRPAKCGPKKVLLYISVLTITVGVIVTLVGHYSKPSWNVSDSSCSKLCQEERKKTKENIANCRTVGPILLGIGAALLLLALYKFWRRNKTGLRWHFKRTSKKSSQGHSQTTFNNFLCKQFHDVALSSEPVKGLSFAKIPETSPKQEGKERHRNEGNVALGFNAKEISLLEFNAGAVDTEVKKSPPHAKQNLEEISSQDPGRSAAKISKNSRKHIRAKHRSTKRTSALGLNAKETSLLDTNLGTAKTDVKKYAPRAKRNIKDIFSPIPRRSVAKIPETLRKHEGNEHHSSEGNRSLGLNIKDDSLLKTNVVNANADVKISPPDTTRNIKDVYSPGPSRSFEKIPETSSKHSIHNENENELQSTEECSALGLNIKETYLLEPNKSPPRTQRNIKEIRSPIPGISFEKVPQASSIYEENEHQSSEGSSALGINTREASLLKSNVVTTKKDVKKSPPDTTRNIRDIYSPVPSRSFVKIPETSSIRKENEHHSSEGNPAVGVSTKEASLLKTKTGTANTETKKSPPGTKRNIKDIYSPVPSRSFTKITETSVV